MYRPGVVKCLIYKTYISAVNITFTGNSRKASS